MKYSINALLLVVALPMLADDLSVVPSWRFGIIADGVGAANLVPADITGDGRPEIISCSQGAPFALEYRAGVYPQLWYGSSVGCLGVTAGDTNGDGATDVIVVGTNGLFIFDPHGFGAARSTATLPETGYDVAFGNVDFDSGPEIVVAGSAATYVYDAATLELQWTATGHGGSNVFIADIDGDTRNEIVVSSGSILDGGNEVFKWGYIGGFPQVAVGNVDADAKAEILFASNWGNTVTVLNGDGTTSTVTGFPTIQQVAVGDANNDGTNEVITGNDQWGSITARRASDSTLVWSISNPEHGCMGIAVADVDGDGTREVLFGGGWTSSGEDALFVGNPLTQAIEWSSLDLDTPFSVAAGDVDGDGQAEIAIAAGNSGSGYDGGVVTVVDALTGAEERKIVVGYSYLRNVVFAQLDADPAMEIAINFSGGGIVVYDGVTGVKEWTSPGYMLGMVIANVDADATEEIMALYDGKLIVMHGISNIVQSSLVFNGKVLAAADVTADGVADVIAATSSTLYVFSSTLAIQSQIAFSYATTAVATPAAGGRIAALDDNGALYLFNGSLTQLWTCSSLPGYEDYNSLAFGTIAGHFRLIAGDETGVVHTMPLGGATCPVMDERDFGATIQNVVAADVTGDGRSELIVGTQNAAEVAHIGLPHEARGDVDGDTVITANDIDALVDYLFGDAPGLSTTGDANADERFSGEDAFALIHYEFGGGTLPE